MSEDFRARIKHKRDNSATWTQNNPVILNGEIIIVDTDNGVRIKVGDGVKKYTQLPFDDELLRSLIDEKVSISQGASEAGKVMKVNSSGDIIPSTIEGSGNISVTNTDSGINIGMSDSIDVSSINMHGLTITGTDYPSASTLNLSGTNPVVVKGVAAPTENDDAANKLYVDTHVADTTKHVTATERSTWNGKAGMSTKVNVTLSASEWSTLWGVPKAEKYVVSDSNITATSAVELLPREDGGITQAQMEALSGAMIVGGTQSNGSIQLIALGDKPTVDIPVTLIIRRDL